MQEANMHVKINLTYENHVNISPSKTLPPLIACGKITFFHLVVIKAVPYIIILGQLHFSGI